MDPSFRDRRQAGEELAQHLMEYRGRNALVLGIPRGGVAVAAPIAQALEAELDTIVLRKIPIPWAPDAGFGAVTAEGDIILDQALVKRLGLTEAQIEREADRVRAEVARRARLSRRPAVAGGRGAPGAGG
jgi:predicted phosphoribosyltransferase